MQTGVLGGRRKRRCGFWAELSFQVTDGGSLAEKVKESLDRFHTPIVVEACDSSHYDYGDGALAG